MSERDFEHLGDDTVFDGRILTVVVGTFRFLEDGEEVEREIVRHDGAVGIVAHDEEFVYLTRQPREAIDDPNSLEIPAGRLDKDGEPPDQAAQRELAEEIGFRAGTIEPMRSYYSSVGAFDEVIHLFYATDLEAHSEDSGENERIEIVPWPLAELDAAIAESMDSKTIIALQMLRERLSSD